jgi:hypothetical protein
MAPHRLGVPVIPPSEPGENDLLLVAAAQRRHVALRISRTHVWSAEDCSRVAAFACLGDERKGLAAKIEGIEEKVLSNVHRRREPLFGALARTPRRSTSLKPFSLGELIRFFNAVERPGGELS